MAPNTRFPVAATLNPAGEFVAIEYLLNNTSMNADDMSQEGQTAWSEPNCENPPGPGWVSSRKEYLDYGRLASPREGGRNR
jgi:hypothetical protein